MKYMEIISASAGKNTKAIVIPSLSSLDGNIFYIGRGEYWLKNHGRVKPDCINGQKVLKSIKR